MQLFIRGVVLRHWRCSQERIRRHSFEWLLHRPQLSDFTALLVDPIPVDTTLSADEQKHILGGEATMWSEWVFA
jgi:hypothetical protein